MASPRIIPQLLERNSQYAKTHTPMPFIPEFPPEAQKPRVIVLACCDARVNPEAALGLKPGGNTMTVGAHDCVVADPKPHSEAIVVRNAGCDVPRSIADILLLSHVRPDIEELLIIQHTDCGVTYTTDEAIREGIKTIAPDHVEQIDNLSFGTFQNNLTSVEERARKSVNFIKASPFIKKQLAENTIGAVYDIKTAAEAAKQHFELPKSVRTYGDSTLLAKDPDIDLVECNTRVDVHFSGIEPSVKARRALYVEWALSENLQRGIELTEIN
ncbi:hypothetical protein AB5N19_04178 [Seiridium cardinale]